MTLTFSSDAKRQALHQAGALNPRPEAVRDPLFAHGDFFDPCDLVQVRYELVRRVQREGASISVAIAAFGVSRSTFSHAQAAFKSAGLPGLLPRRRGPRQRFKLRSEAIAVVSQERNADPHVSAGDLAQRIQERCGLSVHPRTIQRSLARSGKKGALPLPQLH